MAGPSALAGTLVTRHLYLSKKVALTTALRVFDSSKLLNLTFVVPCIADFFIVEDAKLIYDFFVLFV